MKILLTLGLLASSAAFASQVTVAETGGQGNGQAIVPVIGETWTQTGTYKGVSISAYLDGGVSFPGTGLAYLMDRIGSGTTTANQVVAPVNFSVPLETAGFQSLFSGLTLGPGTYYLLISGVGQSVQAGWAGTANPTYTLDAGVSDVAEEQLSGGSATTPAAYAPASSFTATTSDQLFFDVTGTPVSSPVTASTPEPSTWALLASGLVGLVTLARRRR